MRGVASDIVDGFVGCCFLNFGLVLLFGCGGLTFGRRREEDM